MGVDFRCLVFLDRAILSRPPDRAEAAAFFTPKPAPSAESFPVFVALLRLSTAAAHE